MAGKNRKKSAKKKQTHRTATKKSPVRLSQCMIVRNEEANIERALSWGKGLVCEQIVVDTGSSDRTPDLARKLGARVYEYPWNGDFSAAKNFAIEKAKGNWIAFLDADEWFPPEDAAKLIPLLEALHARKEFDVLRTGLNNLDDDGSIISVVIQDRVFRKDPSLRYENPVHERLNRTDEKGLTCLDARKELSILHTGYAGAELRKKKGERDARMLLEEVGRRPHDGHLWGYLGNAREIMGCTAEAMDCYRKVLEDPDMEMTHEVTAQKAGLRLMKLLSDRPAGEIREVREEFRHICSRMKELGAGDHPDIDFFFGRTYAKEGRLKEAAEAYERALEKLETYRGLQEARAASRLDFMNSAVAACAMNEGHYQKAVSFAVSALRADKYSPDGIGILLRAFLTEWEEGASAKPYLEFLQKLYDLQNLKDLLFLCRFSEEAGFPALHRLILDAMPPEVRSQM